MTPLLEAARRGYPDIVEILLQAGANVHATVSCTQGNTCYGGHLFTPLHFSARAGDEKSAIMLLKAGADIHTKDKREETPLHVAGRNGEIVNLLLQAGANIKALAQDKQTPLHIASQLNEVEVVEAMLQA